LSVGSLVLKLDGQELADKPFDFRTRGFLGIKKKGTGIIEDAYRVAAGSHRLLVRLVDGEGSLVGEQTLPATFAGGGRYALKVEMDGEHAVPRFSLTTLRSR
jgi:hypothetical protein